MAGRPAGRIKKEHDTAINFCIMLSFYFFGLVGVRDLRFALRAARFFCSAR